MKFAD